MDFVRHRHRKSKLRCLFYGTGTATAFCDPDFVSFPLIGSTTTTTCFDYFAIATSLLGVSRIMSAPGNTAAATAATAGENEIQDGPAYRSLRIYWGAGDDEIVIEAETVEKLFADTSLNTSEKFADAFYSSCWDAKFGAPYNYPTPYPPACCRQICQRNEWDASVPLEYQYFFGDEEDVWEDESDAVDSARAADQEHWLQVCVANTYEGIGASEMRAEIQQMASVPEEAKGRATSVEDAADESEQPPLRILVNLPADALHYHLKHVAAGLDQYIYKVVSAYGSSYLDQVEEKAGAEHAAIRESIAAAMSMLSQGEFAEQVADEARADRERWQSLPIILLIGKGLRGSLQSLLLIEGVYIGTDALRKELAIAADAVDLVHKQVQTMLLRLLELGFASAPHAAELLLPPEERAEACAEYIAVDCGLKKLAAELFRTDEVRARCAPDFKGEMLQEWCALRGTETMREFELRDALLEQLKENCERTAQLGVAGSDTIIDANRNASTAGGRGAGGR